MLGLAGIPLGLSFRFLDPSPNAPAAENLRRYVSYYAATSFVWDTFRAIGNVVLVVVIGRPLLGALDRASRRMHLELDTEPTHRRASDG